MKDKILDIIRDAMEWTLGTDEYIEGDGDVRHEVTGKKDLIRAVAKGLDDLMPIWGVYLIEKIWIDPMENEINSAVGYKPDGYMLKEEEAEFFCRLGKTYTSKDCWAISDPLPEYRYSYLNMIFTL